jgi:hypothetical protein
VLLVLQAVGAAAAHKTSSGGALQVLLVLLMLVVLVVLEVVVLALLLEAIGVRERVPTGGALQQCPPLRRRHESPRARTRASRASSSTGSRSSTGTARARPGGSWRRRACWAEVERLQQLWRRCQQRTAVRLLLA